MVNLPKKNVAYDFASDNGTPIARIAGWGKTENGTVSQHLLYANMSIVDVEQCSKKQRKLRSLITSQQLCAIQTDNATRPTDTCQGDSGGPLIQYYNNNRDFVQTGITSFGEGCATPGIPGAYARVDHFIDWIKEVINTDKEKDEKLIDGTTSQEFVNVTETTPIIHEQSSILGGIEPPKNTWKFIVSRVVNLGQTKTTWRFYQFCLFVRKNNPC